MPRTARPTAVLVPFLASFLCASASASPASASLQELRWRSGEALQPARAVALQPRRVARLLQERADRHVLVRLPGSPTEREQRLLRTAGIELGRALGGGAYFARVANGTSETLAEAALTGLRGTVEVRDIQSGWKLHPTLAAGETPPWTVVQRDGQGGTTVAVYLLLHTGVELERGNALLESLGGSTFDLIESLNGIVALVPRERVAELAAADIVSWVEPALPRMDTVSVPGAMPSAVAPVPVNDSNRTITQADLVQAGPYNLDGSGVTVLVYDAGTARSTHDDFGGRLTVRDASGMINHATHVSGTIGGDGSASAGTFRGMAPGVTLESYGFEYDGSGIFFFTNPGDFEDDYDEAINVFGAVVANNSIGTNVDSNGFHCPIQGDYGVMCSLIDGVVRGSLGDPMRIVWANGNERGQSDCDIEGFGDYYSTAPPATAKNHITIGALNSNDDSMTSFSSWGPTDDGRLKPDISAPGCQAGGDGGVTSTGSSSDVAYNVACGTSMASPTTCGLSALLIEDWRVQFGSPDPLGSTLKVLLAHTAIDRGNVGPDYQFGYGSVRIKDAIDFMRLVRFAEDSLVETGARARWTVSVAPATSQLHLTLAWDDSPAQPNVFGSLVNDLDLVVTEPGGTRRHVWTLDPNNPGNAAVQSAPDRINNIEQVFVSSPAAGTWTVEVRGHDVPDGPQSFSLASSHALTVVPHLSISFPSDLPTVLTPGVSTPVVAHIVGVGESVVGGSPTLHVRYDGGTFLTFAMSALGGDLYQASLPPPVCSADPEFYFSALGTSSGLNENPAAAPAEVHTAIVATVTTVFTDNFNTNLGWSVVNTALTDGPWERGTPAGDGTRGDPLTAFGGAGQCYVTDNVIGNSDVDGGPTSLLSPNVNCSASGEYVVSYVRWFTSTIFASDSLTVQVSNNGGTNWTTVETVTQSGDGGGWVAASFTVNDFFTPSNQVRLRFQATDNPNDSVLEAGLDSVLIQRFDCTSGPDCNGNGILDSDDIASGRSADANSNSVPDECEPAPTVKYSPKLGPP